MRDTNSAHTRPMFLASRSVFQHTHPPFSSRPVSSISPLLAPWWTRSLPLVAFTLVPSPSCLRLFGPSSFSLLLHHPPPRDYPLLHNKFAAIFLFRGPHIYTSRASTPRRRVEHAAKKAPGGSSGQRPCYVVGWSAFWTRSGHVRVWAAGRETAGEGGGEGELDGWLHTWVAREGGGPTRWEGGLCTVVVGGMGSSDVARSAPGFAGNFFSSSLAREMTYDIFLRGFCWLVSG